MWEYAKERLLEFNTWRWGMVVIALVIPFLGGDTEQAVKEFLKILHEKGIPLASYMLLIVAAIQGAVTPSGSLTEYHNSKDKKKKEYPE